MDDMIKHWDRLLPFALYYDHLDDEDQKRISQQLNEFYFNNEPFLDTNRDNMTKVCWMDVSFDKNIFLFNPFFLFL